MSDPIRQHQVSRIEGFSDAVFGFALTLLVVSLETPNNFEALKAQMLGFVPFALMFAMVCWIWYEHNVFFRRYGLQDAWTVFLNAVLLFVILFYVYPLRFLTTSLMNALLGLPGPNIVDSDGSLLMLLYSGGVLVIFTVFVLLHWHAWRMRRELGLTEIEETQLRFRARSHGLSAGIAVASLLLIVLLPNQSMWAGLIYGLMGPVHGWNGFRGGAALGALRKARSAPAKEPQGQAKTDDQPHS